MASSEHLGPPAACPLTFTVDGETYTLPEIDTRTWLDTLALEPIGCWWVLIPGRLADGGSERLWTRLMDPADRFDLDDLERVAATVLGAACGTDFWAATRLAATAYGNWLVFDGWCWTRGQSSLAAPIGRVLAAVYAWRAQMCQKDSEVTRLNHEVWAGPPTLTAAGHPRRELPTWATGGREEQAFDAFTQSFGARGRG